jgi:hypothetical protein
VTTRTIDGKTFVDVVPDLSALLDRLEAKLFTSFDYAGGAESWVCRPAFELHIERPKACNFSTDQLRFYTAREEPT